MANTWDIGDEPRLTATFKDDVGVATDPTAAIIIVKKPNGTVLTYLSSAGFSSQGAWDASANSPALADGVGTAGHYYTVSTAGAQLFGDKSLAFAAGDRVYYNGKVWRRLQNVQTASLAKPSTGVFYVDQYLSLPGMWVYGSDGVGARAAGEDYFYVRRQGV